MSNKKHCERTKASIMITVVVILFMALLCVMDAYSLPVGGV